MISVKASERKCTCSHQWKKEHPDQHQPGCVKPDPDHVEQYIPLKIQRAYKQLEKHPYDWPRRATICRLHFKLHHNEGKGAIIGLKRAVVALQNRFRDMAGLLFDRAAGYWFDGKLWEKTNTDTQLTMARLYTSFIRQGMKCMVAASSLQIQDPAMWPYTFDGRTLPQALTIEVGGYEALATRGNGFKTFLASKAEVLSKERWYLHHEDQSRHSQSEIEELDRMDMIIDEYFGRGAGKPKEPIPTMSASEPRQPIVVDPYQPSHHQPQQPAPTHKHAPIHQPQPADESTREAAIDDTVVDQPTPQESKPKQATPPAEPVPAEASMTPPEGMRTVAFFMPKNRSPHQWLRQHALFGHVDFFEPITMQSSEAPQPEPRYSE